MRKQFKCFKCPCQQCTFRIWTDDGGFDEVACYRHARDLELHADTVLGSPGVMRHHLTSSERVARSKESMDLAHQKKMEATGRKDCMDCHTPLPPHDRQAGAVRCNGCARISADKLVYSGPKKNHS